jgi:transposase
LNIELDYLPPDSPNLNPIEQLWKGMNEKVRTNIYFQNKRDFIAGIDEFFTLTLANIAVRLWSPINDNFQVLTRASSG